MHAPLLFLQVLGTNNGQVATLQFKPSSKDKDWDSNNWFTAPKTVHTLQCLHLAVVHHPCLLATRLALLQLS